MRGGKSNDISTINCFVIHDSRIGGIRGIGGET